MKCYALALATLVIFTVPATAQYPGPPMWSRDRRDYEPRPRPYGPQYVPCIYYGDCGGPKWGDPYVRREAPGMPPFRLPPPPSRRYFNDWDN